MLSLWYVPVCECVCACVYGAYVEVGRLVRFSLLHHVGCRDQSYLTSLCGGIQRDNFQYMTPYHTLSGQKFMAYVELYVSAGRWVESYLIL